MDNKELLKRYVKAELYRLKKTFAFIPMPQQIIGARNELEFILDLLDGEDYAVCIAKSIITSNEVSDNGSK